jgi:hypothetical protein
VSEADVEKLWEPMNQRPTAEQVREQEQRLGFGARTQRHRVVPVDKSTKVTADPA